MSKKSAKDTLNAFLTLKFKSMILMKNVEWNIGKEIDNICNNLKNAFINGSIISRIMRYLNEKHGTIKRSINESRNLILTE